MAKVRKLSLSGRTVLLLLLSLALCLPPLGAEDGGGPDLQGSGSGLFSRGGPFSLAALIGHWLGFHTWAPSRAYPAGSPAASEPKEAASIRGEIFVEGGEFRMGGTSRGHDQRPIHTVRLSSFWMLPTELRQSDYRALMKANPSGFKGRKRPVDSLTWLEAVACANAMSLKDGLRPAYDIRNGEVAWDRSADGWRLPTEAEWEYAAKGGSDPGGPETQDIYIGDAAMWSLAWCHGNAEAKTHPVGQKFPNKLGLYDILGNVSEWCWDWYGAYEEIEQVDPAGPDSGDLRVIRGGAWVNLPFSISATKRFVNTVSPGYDNIGVRFVRTAFR